MKNVFYISKFASKLLETELKFDLGGLFNGDVTSTTFISGKKKLYFLLWQENQLNLRYKFFEDYLKNIIQKLKFEKFLGTVKK